MTAKDQIENFMLSIARKSVLKTLCPLSSFDVQFPKLDVAGSSPVSRSIFHRLRKPHRFLLTPFTPLRPVPSTPTGVVARAVEALQPRVCSPRLVSVRYPNWCTPPC